MTCKRRGFALLAVLCFVYGCASTALAEQSIWYQSAPQFGAELQVYSDSQWSDTAQIMAGDSIDFRVVKPGTEDDPEDFDTKYVYTWSCVMEPVLTTSQVEDSLTYSYDFGDGSGSGGGSGHTYSSPGVYEISCTVEDTSPTAGRHDGPLTVSATVVVEDGNSLSADPPIVASAVQSISDQGPWQSRVLDVTLGQIVYLRGDCPDSPSYDDDFDSNLDRVSDTITAYNWDFGDGTPQEAGALVSHVFAATGCYLVSLTANDAGNPNDDPMSEASQIAVRVFGSSPASPVIMDPEVGEAYCSLTPTITWRAAMHDQFQVRICSEDSSGTGVIWDSGEVLVEDAEVDCAANVQDGSALCDLTLSEGGPYYAFVRVHNVLGWSTWSAIGHVFTALQDTNPPENASLSPSSGTLYTGTPTPFTVTYSDYCRYTNIGTAELLIDEPTLDGISACHLLYNQNTGQCWLSDDSAVEWMGGEGYTPGASVTLENENVIVDLSSTGVSGADNSLSITWSIVFKASFAGDKLVALAVINDNGLHDIQNPEIMGGIAVEVPSGPKSRITSHASGEYITSIPVVLSGTATGIPGVSGVEISNDGQQSWVDVTGTSTWSYSWDALEDGRYTIKSRATDTATPPVAETPGSGIIVIVDTVVPRSSIIEPAVGLEIVGDSIEVSGTAFDGTSGVAEVELSLDDGVTWIEASGTDFFNYTFPVTASGSYTIRSRAADKAGLVESPGPGVTVTVQYQQQMLQMNLLSGSPGESDLPGNIQPNLFESQKVLPISDYSVANTATGIVLTTIPILGWDSMGDLDLDFSMVHQSERKDRPAGKDKWMYSYQSILQKKSDSKVWVYHPSGTAQYWKRSGSSWVRDTLWWENTDGLTPAPAGEQGFIVTRKDHTRVWYCWPIGSNTWLPKYIEQPTGQKMTLHYDQLRPQQLIWIGDADNRRWMQVFWHSLPDGRSLPRMVYSCRRFGQNYQRFSFSYDSSWRLTGIQYPAPQAGDVPFVQYDGKTISLAYDGEGRLARVTDNLKSWTYSYHVGWEGIPCRMVTSSTTTCAAC